MDNPVLYGALMVTAIFACAGLFFKRMLILRILLLVTCIAAATFAWHSGNMIAVALFGAAAIINGLRILDIQNTSRRIRHIRHYGYNTADLARYMKPISFAKGETIFSKGDPADRLYLIESGTIGIENGAKVEKDGLLGETGLFTKSGIRSMGATALSDVTARTLNAEEASKLCLYEPEFAYAVTQIMATRMAENLKRAG